MTVVAAAGRYHPADDLGIVVACFNPAGHRSRIENTTRFLAPFLGSGLALSIVHADAEDAPSPPWGDHDVHRITDAAALWQKERLLTVAEKRLPARCTKVAWLDGDVLFTDPAWAVRTSRALDAVDVVQPFSRAIRLRTGERDGGEDTDSDDSFAAVLARDETAFRRGRYDLHGHTGFAWAARRTLVAEHGLFDACVAGGADHLMAHAFAGDARESRCSTRLLGTGTPLRACFDAWATRVGQRTIGVVPGDLLHLWHGRLEDRRYVERNERLAASGFDPARDLTRAEDGAWRWSGRQDPALSGWLADYFFDRREDG